MSSPLDSIRTSAATTLNSKSTTSAATTITTTSISTAVLAASADVNPILVNTSHSAPPVTPAPPPPVDESLSIAKKLYDEEFVSIAPEEYIQFLAANDDESSRIRTHYMNLFQWPSDLLQSTRMLCSKLYLKGESQEIDRILSSFTKSYLKQHPQNVFATRNFEQIYIIIYSLILLNTALHNSEVNKKSRISQQDFIKDTFGTFIQQSRSRSSLTVKQRIIIERELSRYYDDLAKNELHLKTTTSNSSEPSLHRRTSKRETSRSTTDSSHTSHTSYSTALSRQISNSSGSIWSVDTNSVVKRINTGTSDISNLSHQPFYRHKERVGLARALATDKENQQRKMLGQHSHASFTSQTTTTTTNRHHIQVRPSMDDLLYQQPVNKRKSFASLQSRESNVSAANIGDDTLSLLSFETVSLHEDDVDDTNNHMDNFLVDNYEDDYDLTLELQGSPYLKEGLLKLRIMNNEQQDTASITSEQQSYTGRFKSFFKKPRVPKPQSQPLLHHKFVENFVVVCKGELSLYSFDPKIIKKQKKKERQIDDDDDEIGDGNWLKNAAKIGNYNLCSTLAQLETPVVSAGKKTYQWSLTFPATSNKKAAMKFLFQAGTKEIALEYVNACNFWAAKITAIPTLEESVSSIEYGWTNLEYLIAHSDMFKKSKNIMKWEPIVQGIYLSKYIINDEDPNHLGMMRQFMKTLKYYNNLKKLYFEFLQKKHTFVKELPKATYNCSNYSRVLSNYAIKINQYKDEIKKYKNYLIMLGFGLQLRFDLEDKDKETEEEKVSDSSEANEATQVESEEDQLTTVIKSEIKKMFLSIKDIAGVIPTFEASKSISDIAQLQLRQQQDQFHMVKSPKTFTLSELQNSESGHHHQQLSQSMKHTYQTIDEEPEEPEEEIQPNEKPMVFIEQPHLNVVLEKTEDIETVSGPLVVV
ncbi:uncharacterized protein SPAPADRAFT_144747 [Spathaspora passalidarum NRRL Y-27907]|uniref:Guanine-nucleotide exchange factor YEL1 n=1 Tax=Spathaspora passalidarum (strain NRRL Y-27907 / 11-Y1) TaxID=619300 RepID=G3AV78_SPAPN|nr:uncharacterized protein SPAPADRAFT_144747 [Spathaspora passalidarum NRRL Y-27907]EGW29881.1 hypothetical protein SPAPADRAFT_144747 [Spathaspora passalidarum NRRL Y-27907]